MSSSKPKVPPRSASFEERVWFLKSNAELMHRLVRAQAMFRGAICRKLLVEGRHPAFPAITRSKVLAAKRRLGRNDTIVAAPPPAASPYGAAGPSSFSSAYLSPPGPSGEQRSPAVDKGKGKMPENSSGAMPANTDPHVSITMSEGEIKTSMYGRPAVTVKVRKTANNTYTFTSPTTSSSSALLNQRSPPPPALTDTRPNVHTKTPPRRASQAVPDDDEPPEPTPGKPAPQRKKRVAKAKAKGVGLVDDVTMSPSPQQQRLITESSLELYRQNRDPYAANRQMAGGGGGGLGRGVGPRSTLLPPPPRYDDQWSGRDWRNQQLGSLSEEQEKLRAAIEMMRHEREMRAQRHHDEMEQLEMARAEQLKVRQLAEKKILQEEMLAREFEQQEQEKERQQHIDQLNHEKQWLIEWKEDLQRMYDEVGQESAADPTNEKQWYERRNEIRKQIRSVTDQLLDNAREREEAMNALRKARSNNPGPHDPDWARKQLNSLQSEKEAFLSRMRSTRTTEQKQMSSLFQQKFGMDEAALYQQWKNYRMKTGAAPPNLQSIRLEPISGGVGLGFSVGPPPGFGGVKGGGPSQVPPGPTSLLSPTLYPSFTSGLSWTGPAGAAAVQNKGGVLMPPPPPASLGLRVGQLGPPLLQSSIPQPNLVLSQAAMFSKSAPFLSAIPPPPSQLSNSLAALTTKAPPLPGPHSVPLASHHLQGLYR